jgi:hypothetical protein
VPPTALRIFYCPPFKPRVWITNNSTMTPPFTKIEELFIRFHNSIRRLVDGRDRITDTTDFYDIEDINYRKEVVTMSKFKGKVILVLNVASK